MVYIIIEQHRIVCTYTCLIRKNVHINHLKSIKSYWLLLNSTPSEQSTDFMKLHKRIFL